VSPFTADAAAGLAGRDGARRRAAARFAETPLPTADSEDWRYSPIDSLDLEALAPVLEATAEPVDLVAEVAGRFADRVATVVVVDGWLARSELDAGWAAKGLEVVADGTDRPRPEAVSAFDHLHEAFNPARVRVRVPSGAAVEGPIVVVQVHTTAGGASFPHLVVEVGPDAEATVVEHRCSTTGDGLVVPLVEVEVADAARARYVELQDLTAGLWQLGRQASTVGAQASFTAAAAVFGGGYARVRTDCRLMGRGGGADLVAAYYGDGDQTIDFRTFQHHEAPDTRSDLFYKGALDDRSGSIYSGLIRIHPDGAGSNAFQTNRNVKLSDDAWAWSVPNLEIQNNDVRCSHASTVSPIDAEQRFYLHSRGVPPPVADRLIVTGFFDEALRRLPSGTAAGWARRRIADKLDKRERR
jgi:Fe-S cluster assembly protein SufD